MLVRTRALLFAATALAAILAAAACGGPDAVKVAVDNFCDELKFLIREQRLERVDDRQFVEVYGDLLESLVATEERVGRPLGPSVEAQCPAASSDAERIQARIELVVETRPRQSHQDKAELDQRSVQPDSSYTSPREVSPDLPSTASTPTTSRSERNTTAVSRQTPDASKLLSPTQTTSEASNISRSLTNIGTGSNQEHLNTTLKKHVLIGVGHHAYIVDAANGAVQLDLEVALDLDTNNLRYIALAPTSRQIITGSDKINKGKSYYIHNILHDGSLELAGEVPVESPPGCTSSFLEYHPSTTTLLLEETCRQPEQDCGGSRLLALFTSAKGKVYLTKKPTLGCHGLFSHFAFSPSGDRVLRYSVGGSRGSFHIYDLKSNTYQHFDIDDWGRDDFAWLSWSPDGQYILGTTIKGTENAVPASIFMFDLKLNSITNSFDLGFTPSTSHQYKASWSPDGSSFALTTGLILDSFRGKTFAEHFEYLHTEHSSVIDSAVVIDIQGQKHRRLSFDDGFNFIGTPVYSSDGNHLGILGCMNCPTSVSNRNTDIKIPADIVVRTVEIKSGNYQDISVSLPAESDNTPRYIHGPSTRWFDASTLTPIATPTPLPWAMDGKSVDELRAIVHDEFGKITLSLAEVFVHYGSEKQRPLAIESMLDAIDSCLLSKEAIEQLGVVDVSYELWPRVAENVGRYCDHLIAASKSLIDWNLIKFQQSISNAMSTLDDAAADVPRL